jgi:hypothetical protein
MGQLRTPREVKELVTSRFERQRDVWLLGGGDWPWRIPLGSPTQADVQSDLNGVLEWVRAWTDLPTDPTSTMSVERVERSWPKLGRQVVPSYAIVPGPLEASSIAGKQAMWIAARRRADAMLTFFPSLRAHRVLGRHFDVLSTYPEDDFRRLVGLLGWLQSNPCSDLYLRQLPVEGLDTKWIGTRRGVVKDFLLAVRGDAGTDGERDLESLLGLRRPEHRVRLRVLCPELRRYVGNVCDIEAPLSDVAQMPLRPSRVLIVENQETALAFPDVADTVVFFKLGLAVGALKEVRWVTEAQRLVYWGDIDTHGYVILDRARRLLPTITSVLMDAATLEAARHLCVSEPTQARLPDAPTLQPHELEVAEGLLSHRWGQQLRLEQERLHWPKALATVLQSVQG